MCLVWILVTLATDASSVFYRKAIIYKKRVEGELHNRKTQQLRQSLTGYSDTTSQINDGASSSKYRLKSNPLAGAGQPRETQWTNPQVADYSDTQALIMAEKERITRLQIEDNTGADDVVRSGSFGAYKNYQDLI